MSKTARRPSVVSQFLSDFHFLLPPPALYLYFIISTYFSQANVTFISTDPTSGICYRPPVAITNTFTLDEHGNWNVALAFNPTLGMFSVKMNNFEHSEDDYAAFIADAQSTFQTSLSNKAPSQVGAPHGLGFVPSLTRLFHPYGRICPRTSSTG